MEINSSQAATAYTTAPATSTVDSNKLKEQNTEPVKTYLNTENTNTAQKPFEVSITQEAREMQAAENAQATQEPVEAPVEEQTPQPEPQTEQTPVAAQETRQIVNIVA
jgi:hypothetical protein